MTKANSKSTINSLALCYVGFVSASHLGFLIGSAILVALWLVIPWVKE